MANTVTQQTLFGNASSKVVIRHIHIVSDGSEETDLVIYDNSALMADATKGVVDKIEAHGSDCVLRFEWDQTTDSPICSMNPVNNPCVNFARMIGGKRNPNGTGATGDVVLTTAGLDSGDEVSIFITVRQV